jgi:hypothetical protein
MMRLLKKSIGGGTLIKQTMEVLPTILSSGDFPSNTQRMLGNQYPTMASTWVATGKYGFLNIYANGFHAWS